MAIEINKQFNDHFERIKAHICWKIFERQDSFRIYSTDVPNLEISKVIANLLDAIKLSLSKNSNEVTLSQNQLNAKVYTYQLALLNSYIKQENIGIEMEVKEVDVPLAVSMQERIKTMGDESVKKLRIKITEVFLTYCTRNDL